jgi:2-oxoglutarate dehydrogenase E2 component (dihydrolipoamide succinyltransferase)
MTVTMPQLGETVADGTVTRWLKTVGDSVQEGEPLLEISTDKVDTEVPSPASGVVIEILVAVDTTVEVGTALAVLSSDGPATGSSEGSTQQTAVSAAVVARAPELDAVPLSQENSASSLPARVGATLPPVSGGQRQRHSPLIRRLAREFGIDADRVAGTGPQGRVTRDDLARAVSQARMELAPRAAAHVVRPAGATAASGSSGRTEPMTRLRTVIAERMVASLHTSAQLTTVIEIDLTTVDAIRRGANSDGSTGVKLTYLAFIAAATVQALQRFPQVNASVDTDAGMITYHNAEHIGIAVDTDRGLLVPVIRDAGRLSVSGLAQQIADVAERTRASKITPDELSGGTFTITNTGSRGALFDTPIINQPQVAILGTGAVVRRPVVTGSRAAGESIAIRSMAYFALTYDHRLVDGADAARFLGDIKATLETWQPATPLI